jgi:uncharacterized membrane protein YdjX (TVP38/TMEM64 family)
MVVLVGIFAAVVLSGVFKDVDAEQIRSLVQRAGPWGIVLFVVLFALGELVHIPGMVFVVAAVLAYGQTTGFIVGWLGAVISVTVSFVLVRTFGGQALTQIKWKVVQRMLDRLDARPVSTVFVLRSLLWVAPPLNFALAMSRIRLRDYLLGSGLGLLAPIAGVVVLFEQALAWVSTTSAG